MAWQCSRLYVVQQSRQWHSLVECLCAAATSVLAMVLLLCFAVWCVLAAEATFCINPDELPAKVTDTATSPSQAVIAANSTAELQQR